MKIDLSLVDCVGIIIKDYRSEIIYSNQTGGTACAHLEQKGYFLPVQETSWIKILEDFNFVYETTRVNPKMADDIDTLLNGSELHSFIRVDRNKLSLSYEGWIHVIISNRKDIIEFNRTHLEGILTWPNSD